MFYVEEYRMKLKKLVLIFGVVVLSLTFIGCSDEDTYEGVGAEKVSVYTATELLINQMLGLGNEAEFNAVFYNADTLKADMVDQFNERVIPSAMIRSEINDEHLERLTNNVFTGLNERVTFEITDVAELADESFNVTIEVYGLDFDYLVEVATDSSFYAFMMQSMAALDTMDDDGDMFDSDFVDGLLDNLGNINSTADYLVELSEHLRLSPRSEEVTIGLEHNENGWYLVDAQDIEAIFSALLIERGYVIEVAGLQRDELGNPTSTLIQRLLDDSMIEFEERHAVTKEQEWYLAFGSFLLTSNQESARVLAIGNSRAHASRILSNYWNVTDRESALTQIRALSAGLGQGPIADEIWHWLLTSEFDDGSEWLAFYEGELFDSFESLANAYRNQTLEAVDIMMENAELKQMIIDDLFDGNGVGDDELRDALYPTLLIEFKSERIVSGIESLNIAVAMLYELFDFTEEELLAIDSLVAWDYARVAIVARYAVAVGFLEEEEVWPYLQLAAESAAATYSSWREFTAAHILGRALAWGNDSSDLIESLDFLLNHSESPFQRWEFER